MRVAGQDSGFEVRIRADWRLERLYRAAPLMAQASPDWRNAYRAID